jgi:predicted acylesterase/phospholipase RssA
LDILAIARNNGFENVLILQGCGSLGAFGCAVFKALAETRVEIDILAGTSIVGINAAIIAGSKDKRPELALEQFWLELAEIQLILRHRHRCCFCQFLLLPLTMS